jgi:simple sugar transport system ATP-binding protein
LYRDASLLILDEPTAVLTPQEVKEFFDILKRLRDAGNALIFISHKLYEVMAISDRVTVLRDGRVLGTVNTGETNQKELARMMVGRDVITHWDKTPMRVGTPVLKIKTLSVANDKGMAAVHDVSLEVREGEILGIAGCASSRLPKMPFWKHTRSRPWRDTEYSMWRKLINIVRGLCVSMM